MLANTGVLWHVGNTVPNLVNRSPTPVEAQVRYERHLSDANVGEIWLGRLLSGNDAGRVVLLRRISKRSISAKDAEAVLYGAEAYSQVRNPALVKLLGLVEQDDELVSVSEYLEGVRLSDLQRTVFDEGVPIPATVAVRLVLDAARATWKAHSLAAEVGLFPTERLFLTEGVLVTSYGATLLSEVGILAALARCVTPRTVPGLLAQLAPEELGARDTQVGSPEVFSLGVVLWELLANTWLFGRRSESHTHQELRLLEIPSLDRIERFGMPVPDTIVQLVKKATERDPARRFASVNELIGALERLPAHFIASEHHVAEVLRQRAHQLLANSSGTEFERGRSGTFAEVRATQPSIAPPSASSHDWDRPTFAQRSLVSNIPPFVGSVTPVAKTQAPPTVAIEATKAPRKPPPRRRRVGLLSLGATMLAVGLFIMTVRGLPERLYPRFLPAPAAAVIAETSQAIPTHAPPSAEQSTPDTSASIGVAADQPEAAASDAAQPIDSARPPVLDPEGSETVTEATTVGALQPKSPGRRAVSAQHLPARKAKPVRSAKGKRDGKGGDPSLDPQWGI